VGFASGLAVTAGQVVTLGVVENTSYLSLFLWDASAGVTNLQASEWSADGLIRFSLTYFTDA
jgi:hypothetical protein